MKCGRIVENWSSVYVPTIIMVLAVFFMAGCEQVLPSTRMPIGGGYTVVTRPSGIDRSPSCALYWAPEGGRGVLIWKYVQSDIILIGGTAVFVGSRISSDGKSGEYVLLCARNGVAYDVSQRVITKGLDAIRTSQYPGKAASEYTILKISKHPSESGVEVICVPKIVSSNPPYSLEVYVVDGEIDKWIQADSNLGTEEDRKGDITAP